MAQDDYYYEIQLTNKQLVFYFLAGSAALVLSFLAGVKVGRGVEETASADAGGRRVVEDRIVPEEPPATRPPAAEDLTYAQRLESEKLDDSLDKPVPAAASPQATRAATPAPPKPAATATPRPSAPPPTTAAAKATPRPAPKPAAPAGAAGSFTIQVGAFKDRASADAVMGRLKGKGFAAYVVAPAVPDGLFNVRVGSYGARPDAERVQTRLRDQEKFKPFIVKN